MVKSIKHFAEESISIFEKLEDDFFKHPEKMAEYVKGITRELHKVGLLMIQESLEQMNQQLKDSGKRTTGWYVEKDSQKQLSHHWEQCTLQKPSSRTGKQVRWSICWTGFWDWKSMKGSQKML